MHGDGTRSCSLVGFPGRVEKAVTCTVQSRGDVARGLLNARCIDCYPAETASAAAKHMAGFFPHAIATSSNLRAALAVQSHSSRQAGSENALGRWLFS